MTNTVQVHRVYIKATPERIWEAITKPEWTQKYGYTGLADFDLKVGGKHRTAPDAGVHRRRVHR